MARPVRRREKKHPPARQAVARIDAIGAGGDGVAIIDGARVFVPLTAPGDIAEIAWSGDRGRLVRLVESGGDRAVAPCRHFGQCGGCALQHLSAEFHRDWKRARISEALGRVGLPEAEVRPTIGTPAAARRRAVFAVSKKRDRALLGFNVRRSREIVDLEDCVVLDPDLLARLPDLRRLAAAIDGAGFDLAATLCDNGLDVVIQGASVREPRGSALAELVAAARRAGVIRFGLNGETVFQFAAPVVRFDGIGVTPPPGAFLQASREGEAALIALVKDAASGAKKIADLFCGCGTFALPLARRAAVYAADADGASIGALAAAAAGAQRAGLKINPVTTEARDLLERPLPAQELNGFDAVIFDPPRAGAAAQSAEIARSDVRIVIAVSCNPASFARDARVIVDGGYTLTRATPVDQFVYSPHVELVGLFRKK